ncbi:MAG: hypothetical protein PHG66_00685 [Candidatus Colwellbacteria bacterium]|nr:hypothetical protein [Candidatus Colwellbacteria bacterium]
MENEDTKRLIKSPSLTDTLGLDGWDTVEYPNVTDQKRIATFEKLRVGESNLVPTFEFVTIYEHEPLSESKEQSIQTDSTEMINDMMKLYERLSAEIKGMRDEIKGLYELSSTLKKEIKDIKTLGEREKNRYVRSNIPFRFIPEHTIGCHQFGI